MAGTTTNGLSDEADFDTYMRALCQRRSGLRGAVIALPDAVCEPVLRAVMAAETLDGFAHMCEEKV